MKTDDKVTISVFVIAITILSITAGIYSHEVGELGQAICEEEHDSDFYSYGSEQLKCQPKEKTEQYDGVEVILYPHTEE